MSRKILVPWAMPEIGREVLRKSKAEVAFLHGPKGELPSPQALIKAVEDTDVLIARGAQPVPRKVMMANPNLRGIANFGVGYDNIDVASATELGIPVTNTPGVLTETTADLAWALLMATARWIPQAHIYTLSGEWKAVGGRTCMGLDIGPGGSNRPKVLGIIGFGERKSGADEKEGKVLHGGLILDPRTLWGDSPACAPPAGLKAGSNSDISWIRKPSTACRNSPRKT